MSARDILVRGVARAGRATPRFRGKTRILDFVHPREGGPERAVREAIVLADGTRLHCDTSSFIEWSLYFLGEYEPETVDLLGRIVRPGWTCVDAGANIGYISVILARAAGPGGRVYSFEALPAMSERLAANIALNGLSNVRIETICLGESRGEANFFAPRAGISNVGQSSLYLDRHPDLGAADVVRHVVQTLPFDEFAEREKLASWDFLKIDVEGAEGRVLTGAERSLRRWHPLILFEANAATQALAGSTVGALLDTLAALGYGFHAHDRKRGWIPLDAQSRRRLETDAGGAENVLASHGDVPGLAAG